MNKRHFLAQMGVVGVGGIAAAGSAAAAGGTTQSGAGVLVAASNARPEVIDSADYVCSGRNDQAQINEALTDLTPTGGLVQLSEGTFYCSRAVSMPRRCALVGTGRATILKATASWRAFDDATGALIEPDGNNIDKTYVSSVALHGNRWSGHNVGGVYYNITRSQGFDEPPDPAHVFSDLYVYATASHGIYLNGSQMRGSKVSRIRVFNVGDEGASRKAHGFYIRCPDGMYSQCESGSSSGDGFRVESSNNHFAQCKGWYADGAGWYIRTPRNLFVGCEGQDNEKHGFYIGSGPNTFVGCQADSNSWRPNSPVSNADGFHIPWGLRVQLVGCSAYDKNESGRGHWQRNGVYLGSACRYCQVIATVANNRTAGVSGTGASNGLNTVMVTG